MIETPIEVFKTDIESHQLAELICEKVRLLFPDSEINFDLDDCDRILRIEGGDFSSHQIIEVLHTLGHKCEMLE